MTLIFAMSENAVVTVCAHRHPSVRISEGHGITGRGQGMSRPR